MLSYKYYFHTYALKVGECSKMYPGKDFCFKAFEWILILVLGGISIYLYLEMFSKYQTKVSTFKRSETNITEVPIITICFNPKIDIFELGKDLNISMFLSWTDFTNRSDDNKLWDNEVNEYSSVKLSKILTTYNGYCYQLKNTSNKNIDRKSTWHVIHIEFDNKTVTKLPTIQVYSR